MNKVGRMQKTAGVSVGQQDTQISKEDQDKINMFSRLNMKSHFMRSDIKGLKEEIDKLEDSLAIVEESFGEGLSLYVGECFVAADEDQATKYVEKVQEEKNQELETK